MIIFIIFGVFCYLLGFFLGRVTKRQPHEKCKTYDEIINREG